MYHDLEEKRENIDSIISTTSLEQCGILTLIIVLCNPYFYCLNFFAFEYIIQ